MNFDFDKMMALARDNPEEFERQRTMLLDELIQSRRDIAWANAFQSHIDMERIKAKNPLACCLRLYSIMWGRFLKLDEQLQKLLQVQRRLCGVDPPGRNKAFRPGEATVMMFKKH